MGKHKAHEGGCCAGKAKEEFKDACKPSSGCCGTEKKADKAADAGCCATDSKKDAGCCKPPKNSCG